MKSNSLGVALVAVLALCGLGVWLALRSGTSPSPTPAPTLDPVSPNSTKTAKADPLNPLGMLPGSKPKLPFGINPPTTGTGDGPKPAPGTNAEPERPISFCFLTRQGPTVFQTLKRYEPVAIPFALMPFAAEVVDALASQGKDPPRNVIQVDQDTEMLADNLGQAVRTLSSTRAYRNPSDGMTLAYEIASTTGGVPQRMVGRLNGNGVTVGIYQGGQRIDDQEIKFPAGAMIMPPDLDAIHGWYLRQEAEAKAKPGMEMPRRLRQMFFIPETLGFVALTARPLSKEMVPLRGQNRECAKYEVLTASTQAQAGLVGRQFLWFDMHDGFLVKREDSEYLGSAGVANLTERALPEDLKALQPLVVRPPELPAAVFPYSLDKKLVYRIKSGEQSIGRMDITYARHKNSEGKFDGYTSISELELDTGQSSRKETAETRYDDNFLPVRYTAKGRETADATAAYLLNADFPGNRVKISLKRDVQSLSSVPTPVEPAPIPTPTSNVPVAPSVPKPVANPDGFEPPLRLVSLNKQNVETGPEAPPPAPPRKQDETLERALTNGTLVMDYNRVEHLAIAAFRFPRKPPPAHDPKQPLNPYMVPATYQQVAFFSVRQNQTGVPTFAIKAEILPPPPAEDLLPSEKEKPPPSQDAQLYWATTTHPLMPCQMLLDSDGRLLQLTMKFGSHEIVYTLDDPLMRQREERARELRGQEGPLFIRPPWF